MGNPLPKGPFYRLTLSRSRPSPIALDCPPLQIDLALQETPVAGTN